MLPINCFNYGQALPKEEHLCRFHVRASLVTFEVFNMEKATRLVCFRVLTNVMFVLRTNASINVRTTLS